MTKHTYSDQSFGIGHTTKDTCPCKPVRKTKHIRTSHRQGYRVEVSFAHNALPVPAV